MNNNKLVFVDESGDEGRTAGASSDYYIVLAIIINEDEYPSLLEHFKGVRSRNFHKCHEMKSVLIGNDVPKRKRVISDITSKSFDISILIVDKSKLTSPGLCFSPSFIKFMHSRLYRNIKEDFHYVHIKADSIKSKMFMDEFERYIHKYNYKTLFSDWSFEFIDSKSNECIQVADILSGTIRRCMEQQETKENTAIFYSYFQNRSYIEIFPYAEYNYLYEISRDERDTFDIHIERRATEEAARFINTHKYSTDELVQERLHCIQILFSDYLLNKGESWVSTNELKEKLEQVLLVPISDQKLRAIIGQLRDDNVLIVSRRSGGYKLPTKEAELYEYLNTQNMTIVPMVNRVSLAHDLIRRATGGKVDILEKDEYKSLKYFVNALKVICHNSTG